MLYERNDDSAFVFDGADTILGSSGQTNPFTLTGDATLTRAEVVLWVLSETALPATLGWMLGTVNFAGDEGLDSNVAMTSVYTGISVNAYKIYKSTFLFEPDTPIGVLDADTYWLTLRDATSNPAGTWIRWDVYDATTSPKTMSFKIFGDYEGPTAAPEPATMLLLALGLMGVAGARREFQN